jgi:hypothetical protein
MLTTWLGNGESERIKLESLLTPVVHCPGAGC